MGKKLTQEEVLEKFRLVHGERYDYSKLEYVNTYSKVTIICKEHGEFLQIPKDHVRGVGCSKCSGNINLTNNGFIEKTKYIHNDKYDYSKVIYINNHTKITIICKEHGEFKQKPNDHLIGNGCPICGRIRAIKNTTKTLQKFIKESKIVHGDKYDYGLTIYKHGELKVKIICPEHGIFEQKPNSHLINQGCSKCGIEETTFKNTNTIEEFVKKANLFHGNKYDYSKVNYSNSKNKVDIICYKHGIFQQTPNSHLKSGCPKCKNKTSFPEQVIYYYIKQIFPNATNRDKSFGKELDIYIPELNLGIEYDGVRWHKDKYEKDLEKNIFFKEKGVDIIRIREKGLSELSNCYNVFRNNNVRNDELLFCLCETIFYIKEKYEITLNFNIPKIEHIYELKKMFLSI